jgi:hypothetical protein
MEGNFVRKFFIGTIVLKNFSTELIFNQWPSVVQDVMTQSGNMTIPYASDCAQILFSKLFE